MGEVMKIMATSFKRSPGRTATLRAPNPAAGHGRPTPPQRLLDTHGQVWVSPLGGHCSFLLRPGAHKFLFVPSAAAAAKSLQSCLTLSDPMDCSLLGSSVHGIFQARVLEWGATALVYFPSPV